MQEDKLLNTHEILQAAAAEPKSENQPLVTQTFKLSQEDKDDIKKICESNGTTVSKFYQKCSQVLISEYKS